MLVECSQFIKSSHRQKFGAEGITIHPRPDERHIRYQDARDLKAIVYRIQYRRQSGANIY
jgi:pyridoxine 5'-phosphate synthase PdxJ